MSMFSPESHGHCVEGCADKIIWDQNHDAQECLGLTTHLKQLVCTTGSPCYTALPIWIAAARALSPSLHTDVNAPSWIDITASFSSLNLQSTTLGTSNATQWRTSQMVRSLISRVENWNQLHFGIQFQSTNCGMWSVASIDAEKCWN